MIQFFNLQEYLLLRNNHLSLFALLTFGCFLLPAHAADPTQPDFSNVPGRVIAHIPAKADKFVGAPSLVKLPNGELLACFTETGPSSDENSSPYVRIYRSSDGGESWSLLRDVRKMFNATLFVHDGKLYLLGTNRHDGDVVISQSADNGVRWTTPENARKGLLLSGKYKSSASPVVIHGGRLWYTIEQVDTDSNRRYPRFSALMLSAPVDAYLLDAASWTASNLVGGDKKWLGGTFANWFGGNPVASPDGVVCSLMSVTSGADEYAALLHAENGGNKLSFNSQDGFLKFDGGAKKFVVRRDGPNSYWSLVNAVPERFMGATPERVQNTLVLTKSDDLRNWSEQAVLLHQADVDKFGFGDTYWIFDGDDICFVSATAYDDRQGGAFNGQSANLLTFHRIPMFRESAQVKFASIAPVAKQTFNAGNFTVEGRGFKWEELKVGGKALFNRDILWDSVPTKFSGARFTQVGGGVRAQILVTATEDTEVIVATRIHQELAGLQDWEPINGMTFAFDDRLKTKFFAYRKQLKAGEKVWIPQTEWHGTFLIAP